MIEISGLHFRYAHSDFAIRIPELSIGAGEKVAIVGPSGSGKTTLLHLVAGILQPLNGSLTVDGELLTNMSDAQRRNFRISRLGFVFQGFELLEYLDVRQNISLPYLINGSIRLDEDVRARLQQNAEQLGIARLLDRRIDRLSQGERQRVAVCRAMLTSPKVILADEPTGSLDPKNKSKIMELLSEHAERSDATLITVTHDVTLLPHFSRVIEFEDLLEGADR